MIIGIDGNEANIKNRVGVNIYAFEILHGLHEQSLKGEGSNQYVIYLKDSPLDDLPRESQHFRYKTIYGKRLWILSSLMPRLLYNPEKLDCFFSFNHYLPLISPVPMICSIMDLGFLKFSGQFKFLDYWQLRVWTAISVFVSKCIIAISKATENDIVRHYPFASNKVKVIYLAFDSERFNPKIPCDVVRRVREKYNLPEKYVLFLGTLKPNKNIEGIIGAFTKVSDYKLVIAGKKGWLYESIFSKVKDLGLENRVVFTDYIEEADKPGLIAGAKVVASPSFWEGFGLHILEAMACGIPVVISNVGSFPEVGGKAAIYVDPYNQQSITDGISKVLSMNKKEYNKLSQACLMQASRFSWEKTTKGILEVIKYV